VAAAVLGRLVESEAIADFLRSASAQPSAVVVEGEPGIGKTTIWQAAVDSAVKDGFQVLSARPAPESVLAYAALADILGAVDADAWAGIPTPQRLALDQVVLRADAEEAATDARAVAAGFVSFVNRVAEAGPILLAIDDLQWLDSSSLQVISFAARRLSGRAGVLGTVRTDADGGVPASWLQLPRLAEVRRIRLGPLTLGALRIVIAERLGRSVSRAAMVQIHEVSQGNPFYALELARVMDERMARSPVRLPGSLAELVRTRIGSLGADVRDVLLAASCVPAPTVELLARATALDAKRVVGLLVEAEDNGIVGLDGHRLNFTHPARTRPRRRPAPVHLAATVAGDLPRYRRRRSIDAPGNRPSGEVGRDSTRDLLTLDQGQMIGPARPKHRRDPARLTQEPPEPGHRLTQRALHLSDRNTTTPHRPDQFLLLDTKAHPTHTHPNLHLKRPGFVHTSLCVIGVLSDRR
jgi:hypothetical protein